MGLTETLYNALLNNTTTHPVTGENVVVGGLLTEDQKVKLLEYAELLSTINILADWNTEEGDSLILNKPDLSTKQDTLISGANIKTINSESILGEGNLVVGGGGFSGDMDDIPEGIIYVKTENNYTDAEKTKLENIEAGADVTDAVNVAAAGAVMTETDPLFTAWDKDYDDLINKPTIPAAQVNSDWNAVSGVAEILNKPAIPAAQVDSDWNSIVSPTRILNKPTIPVNADFTLNGLSEKSYTNLTDKPTILTLESIYPVGCIYTETTGTNPATTFGFGTWEAFGKGKVLIGIDDSDPDFDTVEETGGTKTKAISAHSGTAVANHTNHTHSANVSPSSDHEFLKFPVWARDQKEGSSFSIDVDTGSPNNTLTHSVTQPSAHTDLNIVQPYIVVHFWKRER